MLSPHDRSNPARTALCYLCFCPGSMIFYASIHKGRVEAPLGRHDKLFPPKMLDRFATSAANARSQQIIAIFPKHKTYVEAFAGGAQVLFRKESSEVEVLNDLDGEIVNFFRVCQQHYEELIRYFRFMVMSRRGMGCSRPPIRRCSPTSSGQRVTCTLEEQLRRCPQSEL